jgi:hypothetical protein
VRLIWQLLLTGMPTRGIIHDATAAIPMRTRAAEWLRPRIAAHGQSESISKLGLSVVEQRLEDTRGLG